MRTLWNKFRNWDYSFLFLAFLAPLLILWLIFVSLGVYPFGNNSVLVLDLNGQYVYYFEALRDIVRGGGSLLYSWGRALGGEFMGIFAYYLSSPFSFLVALFPKEHITEALQTIILLKVGSIGATMGFYLHRTYRTSKTKVIIFAAMFAMSSFTVVYGHNLMWLDALIWLPLITYGIEELIKKRRFKLFVVSLAMGVMANFYIGFMLCIYVVIYFIYYYAAHSENGENNFWDEKGHFIKSLGRTALYSLIAVGLAAWIILPTYYSLTFGKTTFSTPDYTFEQKFNFIDFFSKFLYGSYDTVRPEGLPVVYCGILTLILTPFYFISPRVKKREKVMGAVLLGVFIVSFNSTTIDLIWHGLQRPNWLNYRYSFIFIFIMLVFSYRALDGLRDVDFRHVAGIAAGWAILIVVIQRFDIDFVKDLDNIWTSLALLTVFTVILYSIRNGWLREGSVLILGVVVAVELFTSGLLNANSLNEDVVISSRTSYVSYVEKLQPIVDQIKEDDSSFYRMEKTSHRKTNDPFALGFYGLSNSTSTLNKEQIVFLNRMGYSSKSHWSKYLGGTPVSDSLLGLKYIVYENRNPREFVTLYRSDEEHGQYAYLNPYALSVVYAVNDRICDFDAGSYSSPFDFMNAMIGAMTGSDGDAEVFVYAPVVSTSTENLDKSYISGHNKYTPYDPDDVAQIIYKVQARDNKTLYCFFPTNYPREASIMVNGGSRGKVLGNETDRIIELGRHEEGEIRISLTLDDTNLYLSGDAGTYFAYIDDDAFDEAFSKLEKNQLVITEYSDTRLYGNIEVDADSTTLFTTIPYDACWRIWIDGERVETFETCDALLAAHVTPGSHTVELKYVSDSFNNGCVITAGSAILFAICVIWADRAKVKRNRRWLEKGV